MLYYQYLGCKSTLFFGINTSCPYVSFHIVFDNITKPHTFGNDGFLINFAVDFGGLRYGSPIH